MSLSEKFINAVDEQDLIKARVIIKGSLVIDPTFKETDEYINYASKKMADLFDEHDNEEFINDSLLWDEDYMNKELNNLMYNFSRERINHIKDICRYLYKDRIINIETERRKEEQKAKRVATKKVATGVSVAGIGMVAAGVICSKAIITVSGAVLLVGGATALISENIKK